MSPEEARTALAAARAGDQRAWTALFHEFTPIMERAVERYGGGGDDTEAIVQEAWIRLLRWIRDPVNEVRSVRAWLVRAARNRWFDVLRHKRARGIPSRHQAPTGVDPVADHRPSPSSALGHKEFGELLAKAHAALSEEERVILRWIVDEGLSRRDAGARLGISADAAKARFLRAERRFRRVLRDFLGSA